MVSRSGKKKLVLENRNKEAGGTGNEARRTPKPTEARSSKLLGQKDVSNPSLGESKRAFARRPPAVDLASRMSLRRPSERRQAEATPAVRGGDRPLGEQMSLGPAERRRGQTVVVAVAAGVGAKADGRQKRAMVADGTSRKATWSGHQTSKSSPEVVQSSSSVGRRQLDWNALKLRGQSDTELLKGVSFSDVEVDLPVAQQRRRKKKKMALRERKRMEKEKEKEKQRQKEMAMRMRNLEIESRTTDEQWKQLKPHLMRTFKGLIPPELRLSIEDESRKYSFIFEKRTQIINKLKEELNSDTMYMMMSQNCPPILDTKINNMQHHLKQLRDDFTKHVHKLQRKHMRWQIVQLQNMYIKKTTEKFDIRKRKKKFQKKY